VGPKLGRPGHCQEVVYERCLAHPSHRGLDMSLQLWYSRIELRLEVPTLEVEPALTRPLHSDAGVLSRMSAVELGPQVFGPCIPHCWGVHRAGCATLTMMLPGHGPPPSAQGDLCQVEEAVDVHCLSMSGEAAASGGLWSSSLAATNGPFGAGYDRALEACSAACCDATHATTLDGGRREACGADDATSSPNGCSWCSTTRGIVIKSLDQAQTKPSPYLARQVSEDFSSRVVECTRLILV
jgi:hypothetical protein